jgi:HlyD family secretion protein
MKMDFLKHKKKLLLVSSIVIVLAVAAVALSSNFRAAGGSKTTELTAKATKGNIKVEISGSGVIEPIERYDITALVNGNIVASPYEEGQQVKKGDILYKFDATEIQGNIQKNKNNIAKLELSDKSTRKDLSKTVIYAPESGVLSNFNVKVNDTINPGKVGEIINNNIRIARVPFSKSQLEHIKVGDAATVLSGEYMAEVSGTVSKISSISTSQKNGVILYDVEIITKNTDTIAKGSKVSARIGNIESPAEGTLENQDSINVNSELSGRAVKVYVSNNENVVKGQKLFELDNDSYLSSISRSSLDLSDARLTLESAEKQLEDYYIKSPINGIVLVKNNKAGDTINSGIGAQPLMVVADSSRVKFSMKIDELDISKIVIGQKVSVVADALPDTTFIGKVTSIAGEGTAANGVSSYTVEVTIDSPGNLKSGMNITAKTIVAEKENALLVPASAIQKKDGKSFVVLPADQNGKQKSVDVELGLNNKDYVEIISGLKEGEQIVLPAISSGDSKSSGGMMGGGASGGNPQGMGPGSM